MTQTLNLSLLGLDQEWPDTLFVLKHEASGRFGCYCHLGVHGLAVFSQHSGAVNFAEFIQLDGMAIESVNFDEAREIAKARPMPVVSVMLVDDLSAPIIHYIR